MKHLVIPAWQEEFPADVDRLLKVARANGYDVGRAAAAWAWEEHSEGLAAGWLIMDSYTDDQLLQVLLTHLHCEADRA